MAEATATGTPTTSSVTLDAPVLDLAAARSAFHTIRPHLVSCKNTWTSLHERLDAGLSSQDLFASEREMHSLEDAVGNSTQKIEALQGDLDERRASLQARREALALRKERLAQIAGKLQASRTRLKTAESLVTQYRTGHRPRLRATIDEHRASAVARLSSIFPIVPLPSHEFVFSIAGAVLPSQDASLRASALGFAARLTLLLADYLRVPLLYPVLPHGSSSVIIDTISTLRGLRAFPLYTKNVEPYRAEYAVFLLNKDIAQLMYARDLVLHDLRDTLPNLKTLLLHVTTPTSPRDIDPVVHVLVEWLHAGVGK